ncbi:class I SAM-dependent methyltransferase [Anaeromusa sp.]|jgi:ubiquinone/menaquinone biosynthesis C-methylase UbiE|uniref:class I SAM-dependent methyltransferase n=1 Tax=Anaeromusa sp. TaxID=1872520 RepID=UPI00262704AC|nr:class I SAM-dependent methyltransferase [Anaeromusa sp.]MDD3158023.1 class I SAM-dependent methyltransferase [Anaeromusa sp.]
MNGCPAWKQDLTKEVQDYWRLRSESYSAQNLEELHSFKREAWRSVILEQAPAKETLSILDVGTGPGFFAINLALAGHEVTAVDLTQAMLNEARKNALHYGAKVHFLQANVHDLPFEEATFDLIVCRNVVWNLEKPEAALAEWARVLRPGGRMLYFDANWYLYLFDEKRRLAYEKDCREAARLYKPAAVQTPAIGAKMEEIAYELPLSCQKRPQWDRSAVGKVGLQLVCIDETIGKRVWSDEEQLRYASMPLFMVCAERPC